MHPNVKIKRFCVVLTPTDLFCLLFPPPAYLFVLGPGRNGLLYLTEC